MDPHGDTAGGLALRQLDDDLGVGQVGEDLLEQADLRRPDLGTLLQYDALAARPADVFGKCRAL